MNSEIYVEKTKKLLDEIKVKNKVLSGFLNKKEPKCWE